MSEHLRCGPAFCGQTTTVREDVTAMTAQLKSNNSVENLHCDRVLERGRGFWRTPSAARTLTSFAGLLRQEHNAFVKQVPVALAVMACPLAANSRTLVADRVAETVKCLVSDGLGKFATGLPGLPGQNNMCEGKVCIYV